MPPRDPPANVDAERALLGTLLLYPDRCADVADLVEADDFFKPSHGDVYSALMTCRATDEAVDAVTVVACLRARGRETQA